MPRYRFKDKNAVIPLPEDLEVTMRRTFSSLLALLLLAPPLCAQTLPVVSEVEWPHLRDHCRELLRSLDAAKAPLPPDTVKALRDLLDKEPADPDAAVAAVQKLLDPHCLIGVSINPESRVKAAHGAAATDLRLGHDVLVLIRVHNEGGVTSAGDERFRTDRGERERRLAERDDRHPARLSGRRLEYVGLRLAAREAGKREATFRFDVGQGTQDLGFARRCRSYSASGPSSGAEKQLLGQMLTTARI